MQLACVHLIETTHPRKHTLQLPLPLVNRIFTKYNNVDFFPIAFLSTQVYKTYITT